jgi:hypothetical protein
MPSMVVTREGFTNIVAEAFGGMGFPAEAPSVYEFPMPMFLAASDLSPLRENIDKIIYGLTKWEPKTKQKGVFAPPKVTVEGKDYQEAFTKMNNLFVKNMWSDGLPVLPPTEERVSWIMTGTDLPRDKLIGKILPRGGIATVETLAIALAMAGGRPEYMPVFIAVVEAFMEPEFRHDWMNTTTGAVRPGVIVNGTIAKQIRLNSGYGCFGPYPGYPAGGIIGRAIRLLLMDAGGGIAEVGSMSIHGSGRYTNLVFAEDEDGLPPGWKSVSVERGFPPKSNVATVFPLAVVDYVFESNVSTPQTMKACLDEYVRKIGFPHLFSEFAKGKILGMVVFARGTAAGFAGLGLSKEDVRNALWNDRIPWSTIVQLAGRGGDKAINAAIEGCSETFARDKPWPRGCTPQHIMIAVAGGAQSGHAAYLSFGGASGNIAISKNINLPANWNELIKQAEIDLGPIPVLYNK